MSKKIFDLDSLVPLITQWKDQGEEVVFTNGCFDLLHPGHIQYLQEARQLGSRLVVGTNSDSSIKRLKGANRPIINEKGRLLALAALEAVDAVILFEEDTPLRLIEALIPDVLVKGSDYKKSNIVGADIVESHGGKVELINLVPGYSTTEIIKKIKTK